MKIKKIIIVFILIFLILTAQIYATNNPDMNVLNDNNTEEEITEEEASDQNNEQLPTENKVSNNTPSKYVTSVTPINSNYDANLSLNNILSVFLIVIGILLIILDIAILIKLK